MKPLNDFQMWIVKLIIGDDYLLARFGEKDGEKGCYLAADGCSIVDLIGLRKEIDNLIDEHVSVHVIETKKPARKSVKKVAKKHE
jgi:hypothetical protein